MPTRRPGAVRILAPLFLLGLITVSSAEASLPSPWLEADIGGASGTASTDPGKPNGLVITSSGNGPDMSHFVYRAYAGDFVLVAKVEGVRPFGGFAGSGFAGLMVREQDPSQPTSRFAACGVPDPNALDLHTFYRVWNGDPVHAYASPLFDDPSRAVPYQKLVRYGDQISFWESPDGIHWAWAEGYTLPKLARRVYVGMWAMSMWSEPDRRASVTFSQVSVRDLTLPYRTGWIGNTFEGKGDSVTQDVAAIALNSSGSRLFTNTPWDESAKEGNIYLSDGTMYGALDDTHRHGGYAIAADAEFVYMGTEEHDPVHECRMSSGDPGNAYSCPPDGKVWFGVRRYDMAGTPVGFAGGRLYDHSLLVVEELPEGVAGAIKGLAVDSGKLFVSDTYANAIRIYSTDDLDAAPSSFSVDSGAARAFNPRGLAVEADANYVRILVDDRTDPGDPVAKIVRFRVDGTKQPEVIQPLTGARPVPLVPTALAIEANGNILVADNGVDQQIKEYDPGGSFLGALGRKGGIYAWSAAYPKGTVRPLRFDGPVALALDANGNLYVACELDHGTVIRKLRIGGASPRVVWEVDALEFIGGGDFDPGSDGTDIYSTRTHYTMDYSRAGGHDWTYKGVTLDRFSYPDDIRLHEDRSGLPGGVMVRRYQGNKFLFLTMQEGGYLAVYRFDSSNPRSGEIAIPCGLFAAAANWGGDPNNNFTRLPLWPSTAPDPRVDYQYHRWFWIDRNGDGRMQPNDPVTDPNGEYDLDTADPNHPQGSAPTNGAYGWYVDSNLTIWMSVEKKGGPTPGSDFRAYRLAGVQPNGVPVWSHDAAHRVDYRVRDFDPDLGADPGVSVARALYVPATDTMFLGVYRDPDQDLDAIGQAGREFWAYPHWSDPGRRMAFEIDPRTDPAAVPPDPNAGVPYFVGLPYCGLVQDVKAMSVLDNRLFLLMACTKEVRVYDTTNLETTPRPVKLLRPGPEVGGFTGGIDVPQGIAAFRRANGDYLLVVEDSYAAKLITYRY